MEKNKLYICSAWLVTADACIVVMETTRQRVRVQGHSLYVCTIVMNILKERPDKYDLCHVLSVDPSVGDVCVISPDGDR